MEDANSFLGPFPGPVYQACGLLLFYAPSVAPQPFAEAGLGNGLIVSWIERRVPHGRTGFVGLGLSPSIVLR